MKSYFLPAWTHLCFTPDGAIFLDVKHDTYFGLDGPESLLLRRLVDGNGLDPESHTLAQSLIDKGLLTTDSADARPLSTPSIDAPDSVLLHDTEGPVDLTVGHIARFLTACVMVWARLHLGSFEHAIHRLQARKARLKRLPRSQNLEDAKDLMRVFDHLRTFIYTDKEHCLYDSLVLSDFLQRFDVTSDCIFGVRTLPFGAHCWVQVERSLAADTGTEQVAVFSPILVI